MAVRHVILDRDGVLNQEAAAGGYVLTAAQFRWLPGALEGLSILHRAGIRLSLVTNQSGIGRGLMTTRELEAVHDLMRAQAAAYAPLDAVFVCPHAPQAGCECRKPAPGLMRAAIDQSGIAAADSIAVGDDRRDLEAAWSAGMRAALVLTGKGRATEPFARSRGVATYDDLAQFARAVVAGTDFNGTQMKDSAINEVFAEHATVTAQAARELPGVLERVVGAVHECLEGGHKVLACGNGGSAADAQHLVAELVGRFRLERRALPAVALNADTAILTALSNDYGYENVFARQVEALARPGDLLFAISTSGNSQNVVRAAQTARLLGCRVVAFTGAHGGQLAGHADLLIQAPSQVVARIQEMHTLCIHAISESLDRLLAHSDNP
jgi:D-sedoheptulose 7-phosphate isomerase